jgi:hypothetical protein
VVSDVALEIGAEGAVSAELTVTVTTAEGAEVTGVVALSVTV